MQEKAFAASRKIGFIETMDCLAVSKLPEGLGWTYEIKLDGYRLQAVKSAKMKSRFIRANGMY